MTKQWIARVDSVCIPRLLACYHLRQTYSYTQTHTSTYTAHSIWHTQKHTHTNTPTPTHTQPSTYAHSHIDTHPPHSPHTYAAWHRCGRLRDLAVCFSCASSSRTDDTYTLPDRTPASSCAWSTDGLKTETQKMPLLLLSSPDYQASFHCQSLL